MTDWVANSISIASLGATIVLGVLQLRKDGERSSPPERAQPPAPEEPPAGPPRRPRPAHSPPERPQPERQQPEPPRPVPPPPPPVPPTGSLPWAGAPDRAEPTGSTRGPGWMTSPRRAFLYSAVITGAITALLLLVSGDPVVRAGLASGLLVAVLGVWLARRARSAPSPNLAGLLLLLVGLAGTLAILAVPLASALRIPQVVVALTVPWFLLSRLTDRVLARPAGQE
ncbi:hypothetical protein [Actinomadura sp. NPDC048394]|uniref:hypothetical protein n=1 Tax=Actinomadura sp. NPDC048394 TaxID=3158223 RepID=UPI0033FB36A2